MPNNQNGNRSVDLNDSLYGNGLRENQAQGIIIELSNLLMQRFDVLKQGIWDGDSSTIFFPDKLMKVPKSFDFIPMGDAGVTQSVNEALDKSDEVRQMFRETMHKLQSESNEAKRQLAMYQTRVRQAIDLIDGKNISRAKMLLKVDGEFLRRTLSMTAQHNGEIYSNANNDCKQIFSESVDAMKMLSFQVRQGQPANAISHQSSISAEMDLLGFNSQQQ